MNLLHDRLVNMGFDEVEAAQYLKHEDPQLPNMGGEPEPAQLVLTLREAPALDGLPYEIRSQVSVTRDERGTYSVSITGKLPPEASVRLLKNLADTLVGPSMSAGLAARFFDNAEAFFNFAKTFKPPKGFEDQYQDRLKQVEERGLPAMQVDFWRTEALCRKEIERAAMGFRMRKRIE